LLPKDDKSQYLALAGYTLDNWEQLQRDLREQILGLEANLAGATRYGQKYSITGKLLGPNGQTIRVKTIWIVSGKATRFVTFFPAKEQI
jgi:hypothetical protein